QLRDWVYRKLVLDAQRMSNLSKNERTLLQSRISFGNSTVAARQLSTDATLKLLLNWGDGATAETVMIPDGSRRTACVSSQFGCPVGCRCCASGIGGVRGNLTPGQIVEQVMRLDEQLSLKDGSRIGNVVFMGMGEPLANYANVMKAVRILHDPKCLNIG